MTSTDTPTLDEGILNKVSALLAKAERTDYPAEAQAFMAKAQALMARHSISQAMLASADRSKTEAIVERKIPLSGTFLARRGTLAYGVATRVGCKAYTTNTWTTVGSGATARAEKGLALVVLGFASDVEWAETLITSLLAQMDVALAAARKADRIHGKSGAVGFVIGFTNTVCQRLGQINARTRDEVQAEYTGTSVALVLADKSKRVEDEYKVRTRSLNLRPRKISAAGDYNGYGAGRAAGQKAGLARGSIGGRTAIGS